MQLAVLPYVAGTDSRITQNTHALAMGVRFERTQAFFLNFFHMRSNIYWESNRPAIGLHPDKVQI